MRILHRHPRFVFRTSSFGFNSSFEFRHSIFAVALLVLAIASNLRAAAPTSAPADSKLWTELQQIDAKSAHIDSVTADFEQRKFTMLMKKPLVSTGHVAASGITALWKTDKPQPTSMLVDPKEIRIYYPVQSIVEIYPVQGQLGALAASPLPRLSTLQKFFTFDRDSAASLDAATTDDKCLAVRLTPSNDELRQHVKQVRVLLDRETGAVRRAENTDSDGERTLMIFSQMKLGEKLPANALKLIVAPGTKEVHPLEGLGNGDDHR
jgi:outer membrane lipoprotein-sorting protein